MKKAYESERVYEINSEEWFLGRMLGIPQSALKEKIEKTKPQHIAADHSLQMISNLEKKLSELRGEIYQTMRKSPGDEEEQISTPEDFKSRDLAPTAGTTNNKLKASFGESTHQTYRLIEDEGHMLRRGLTAENYEMIKGLAVVLRISETEVLHRLEKNGVL